MTQSSEQPTPERLPRRVRVLQGNRTLVLPEALVLASSRSGTVFWLGPDAPDGVVAFDSRNAVTALGRESDLLVLNALDGLDADAFAALLGTLRGGGLAILIAPVLCDSVLLSRLVRHLLPLNEVTADVIEVTRPAPAPTPDQERVIEAVQRVAFGHRNRPLLLTADRGRGKSAALGWAAKRALRRRPGSRVLVTAPRREAVAGLLECAAGEDPAVVRFFPPDVLLREKPPADLLLVDEAAAIPLPVLEAILDHYHRVALATTLHGYEGSGRGLVLKLRQRLEQRAGQWHDVRLETPVRWSPNDRLEPAAFAALCLDAEIEESAGEEAGEAFQFLEVSRLADDEPLLRQVMALLIQAHYQTRPRDLQRLLDEPEVRLLALLRAGVPVALAMVLDEGGLDAELAARVANGERRRRGHLGAQTLAATAADPRWARLPCWRVTRIAVAPELQRTGLGRCLLGELIERARPAGKAHVCVSFGASAGLLEFWRRAGFVSVRVGARRDAASGAHSVIMVRPLSEEAELLSDALRGDFQQRWWKQLRDGLQELESDVVGGICRGWDTPAPDLKTRRVLELFADGRRDYQASLSSLHDWARHVLATGEGGVMDLLVGKILQGRSFRDLSRSCELPGAKAVQARLRAEVRDWLRRTVDVAGH